MTMLEKIRKARNMTRQQLSDESGVPLRTIEAYEQGINHLDKTQINNIDDLAEALDVSNYAIKGFEGLTLEVQALFEELCLASDEELLNRNDETGNLIKSDKFLISCITGDYWYGDMGTQLEARKAKKYAKYFISKLDLLGKVKKEQYFAGSKF